MARVNVYICDQCDHVEDTEKERKTCTLCGHKVVAAGWAEYHDGPVLREEDL